MMVIKRKSVPAFSPGVLVGGAVAGLVGAICMGLAISVYVAASGGGWSTPMQAVAGTFYKSMAFVGGPGVTVIGVLTHLSVGAVYGVLFAAMTRKIHSVWGLFLLGIPYAVAIWAFMTYVTLPVFDWVMYPRVQLMIPTMWFFAHWIYGAFMGLFVPLLRDRSLARESGPGEAPQIRRTA